MDVNLSVALRLSAQRALLGQIPPSLRAVSIEADEKNIYFRCIFDGVLSDEEWELLSCAAAEIIASFSEPYMLEEEYLHIEWPQEMSHLANVVFWRHEGQ